MKNDIKSILTEINKALTSKISIPTDLKQDVDFISTGISAFDKAFGGGIPRGRITEIYGQASAGKTMLCLQTMANAQKEGMVGFVDMEHAISFERMAKMGVKMDEVLYSTPEFAEDAFEAVEAMVTTGKFSMIVVDSVSALVPRAELEGEYGQSQMGLQARIMSQAMRKLVPMVHKNNVALVFINQIRSTITSYGSGGKITSGGQALSFYCSLRINLKRIGNIKTGDEIVGGRYKMAVDKNKLSEPYKTSSYTILDTGISAIEETINQLIEMGALTKSGAWYKDCGGEQIAQGFLNLTKVLTPQKEAELIAKLSHNKDSQIS